MGERGIDFEGFAGDASGASGGRCSQRAHVVQAVGHLDEDHADVGDHGEQHLADVLGLVVFAVGELDLSSLVTPSTMWATCSPNCLFDLFGGDGGVFDGVVQQAGGDGGRVHLHLGQNEGHFEGMHGVGLARGALLTFVLLEAKFPGLLNDGDVVAGAILAHGRKQHLEGLSELLLVGIWGCRSGVRGGHN